MENAAIYGGGPLAVLAIRRAGILLVALWLGAVTAWLGTRGQETLPRPGLDGPCAGCCSASPSWHRLVTLAIWLVFSDLFLSLPRDRLIFWAIIMVQYQLLAVRQQGMLDCALLFHR